MLSQVVVGGEERKQQGVGDGSVPGGVSLNVFVQTGTVVDYEKKGKQRSHSTPSVPTSFRMDGEK